MCKWKAILLLGVFCSCETIVDLDIPEDYQSRLVVESLFSPDSLWKFRVGRSIPQAKSAELNEFIVSNAKIVLSNENTFLDTLQYIQDGIYRTLGGHRPQSGTTYKVHVKANGFEDVNASSWAPPLESKFLKLTHVPPVDSSKNEQYILRFDITDGSDNNYYRIHLYQVVPFCRNDNGSIITEDASGYAKSYQTLVFDSKSPSFHALVETVDDPLYPNLDNMFWDAFFSDQLFKGTTQEFEIIFEPMTFESFNHYFMLVISALSDDLFAYERSLVLHDYYLFGPTIARSSPEVVHTNISHGLGIFAGYTNDTYRFDAEGNQWQEDSLQIGFKDTPSCQ